MTMHVGVNGVFSFSQHANRDRIARHFSASASHAFFAPFTRVDRRSLRSPTSVFRSLALGGPPPPTPSPNFRTSLHPVSHRAPRCCHRAAEVRAYHNEREGGSGDAGSRRVASRRVSRRGSQDESRTASPLSIGVVRRARCRASPLLINVRDHPRLLSRVPGPSPLLILVFGRASQPLPEVE